ncbi:MAG: M14 family metallopeptidase, partial [Chitinophagaceae bacterium]
SNEGKFAPRAWHRQKKTVIQVNNGIHPGEPDGIDASVLLARDLAIGKTNLPDNVVLAIIPVYNIGGCLNRSANYRVDQNGPEEFGFRGNSQNLDLNRDFIKCDSKEARSFAGIYHFLDPDVFVDNHVSNGADYQHIMTLISSQHSKLGGAMGQFMNRQFEPGLYARMKEKGYDLVPYVNFFGETPDKGWPEFFDSPRYSSGFATLWNAFGFTTETHMLKSYEQRVKSTYALMECFIDFASAYGSSIQALREQAKQGVKLQASFPVKWILDSSKFSAITYKGFEATKKTSGVSGLPRLFYDRSKPFEKKIDFYNFYEPAATVQKPVAYIIPQGWWKVVSLLEINKVHMYALPADTVINVEVYEINDYKSSPRQYEMHHPNSDATVNVKKQSLKFRKGDFFIPMNQIANRFLVEVLEPQSNDSYFAWNFFDAILTQKEGYSNYVFEEKAEEYLKSHPETRSLLEQRRVSDTAFAKSARAQLDFVFRSTPYIEPDYLRYPVYRVR